MTPFELADAISVYYGRIDNVHKLWGYVQVIAAGAAGFAWTSSDLSKVRWYLLAGLAIFTIANSVLMFKSQRQARITADAIHAYWHDRSDAIAAQLRPVVAAISPAEPWQVVGMNVLVNAAAAVAVLLSPHWCG